MRWRVSADEIRVDVRPERFTFHTPRQSFELPAVLAPAGDAERGDPLLREWRSSTPVGLFRLAAAGSAAPSPFHALVVYLRRALIRCTDDRVLKLKPHLVFRGAASLDPHLSGFQHEILLQAAFAAGARTVRFEPEQDEAIPREYAGTIPAASARGSRAQ
jgi:hypothetical protein